jgi:hypothetical protein
MRLTGIVGKYFSSVGQICRVSAAKGHATVRFGMDPLDCGIAVPLLAQQPILKITLLSSFQAYGSTLGETGLLSFVGTHMSPFIHGQD